MKSTFGSPRNIDLSMKSLTDRIAARQRALDEIDGARFGWYHVRYIASHLAVLIIRAIMVAGSGFFTDAYDIFSVNLGMSIKVIHALLTI